LSLTVEPLAEVQLEIPAAHAAFEGHFPGEPILPGVALLDFVVATLQHALGPDWRLVAIPSVRWRCVVRPGDALQLRITRLDAEGQASFVVRGGDRVVSDGRLVVVRTGC
jgi:3-hydroxymyristoyl/3-hydroxydecanoyl-(acyl carrier protein) dehydratase